MQVNYFKEFQPIMFETLNPHLAQAFPWESSFCQSHSNKDLYILSHCFPRGYQVAKFVGDKMYI